MTTSVWWTLALWVIPFGVFGMNCIFSRISVALALTAALTTFAYAAADQCMPIGWATRSGRTSTAFEVTGGGNLRADTVRTFADLKSLAADKNPHVIYIDGDLGSGWNGKSGDRVDVSGSNKTIIGLKPGTKLNAVLYIKNVSNIIVRNIVIQGHGSNQDQAWDNLNIENSKNVWIDHCEFWDGQDGNADVVKGADNVTFTWCKFGYKIKSSHNLSNLIASSDKETESQGKLNVTFMFNWWVSASQRMPRCRFGNIHVVNNLYTSDASVTAGTDQIGVSAGVQCHVRTEKNVFIGINNPIYNGNNTDGTGGNEVIDNIFTSCSGNTKGTGTSFTPPYDYNFMLNANQVEAAVRGGAGATLESPTACDANYQDPVDPPPPPPDTTREYQVDKGTVTNSFIETANAGYHGDAYVNFDKGGKVSVDVNVAKAGEYKMVLDFTNGSGSARDLEIGVGGVSTKVSCAATSSWTTWEKVTTNLTLDSGKNTIVFSTVGGADGPNLDQFDLILLNADGEEVREDSAADTSKTDSTLVPADTSKNDSGTTSIRMQVATSQSAFEVSFFDTKGMLVRKLQNVNSEALRNPAELSRSLPAGIYLMQVRAPGKNRQSFVVVK